MSNLIDIQSQIAKLEKQAADIKAKEFDKTLQDILAKMQAFGITLKDVQLAMGKPRAKRGKGKVTAAAKPAGKRAVKRKGATVAAKYHGPNGETWSGRGLMPRWMAALVAKGRSKEDFVIRA
jgi:DNA-binding protein H-NS